MECWSVNAGFSICNEQKFGIKISYFDLQVRNTSQNICRMIFQINIQMLHKSQISIEHKSKRSAKGYCAWLIVKIDKKKNSPMS